MFTSIIKKLYLLLSRRQKITFLIILLCMGISAVLTQVIPLFIGRITDTLTGSFRFLNIVPFLIVILCVLVANETLKIVRRLAVENVVTSVEVLARKKVTRSLLLANLDYFNQNMTGRIYSKINHSLDGVLSLLKLLFMDFVPSILTSIAAIVLIFVKLPFVLACVTIMVIPIGIFIILRQITSQKGIRVKLLEERVQIDAYIVELINGIETVRVMNTERQEINRCAEKSEKLRAELMHHHYKMGMFDFLKFLNEAVFNVIVLSFAVYLASVESISVGAVLTAYLCFLELLRPLRELHRILDELSENVILANEYFALTEIEPDFSYHTIEKPDTKANGIVMKNITFKYNDNKKQPILKDFSLSIKPHSFVGFVGKSGCGKSTLIKLILKLVQLKDGDLYINNKNILSMSRADIADTISLVPQSPFLIADTVFNNIAYGMKGHVSANDVHEAAKKACIHADILKFKDQYDYMLSEGGKNISGGQRQRIALARIFLKKPKILILDEATSALDNITEKKIQQEIEDMAKKHNMTVIVIAHRLTTLVNCDTIFVVQEGNIIEQGTYQELLDKKQVFYSMAKAKTE